MSLQNQMISAIDNYCGKDFMLTELKQTSLKLGYQDKELVEHLIIYINSIYTSKVDIVSDLIEFKVMAEHHVVRYCSILARFDCLCLSFMLAILKSNLNYVNGLRKLA